MSQQYAVYVNHLGRYDVEADSPEDAARYVEEGDGGHVEWERSVTERVVASDDDEWAEDLRASVICSTCHRHQDANGSDPCVKCWLDAKSAERAS